MDTGSQHMFKVPEQTVWQYNQRSSLFTKMRKTLFGIGIKQPGPSNKPMNNINYFDETATARTVILE